MGDLSATPGTPAPTATPSAGGVAPASGATLTPAAGATTKTPTSFREAADSIFDEMDAAGTASEPAGNTPEKSDAEAVSEPVEEEQPQETTSEGEEAETSEPEPQPMEDDAELSDLKEIFAKGKGRKFRAAWHENKEMHSLGFTIPELREIRQLGVGSLNDLRQALGAQNGLRQLDTEMRDNPHHVVGQLLDTSPGHVAGLARAIGDYLEPLHEVDPEAYRALARPVGRSLLGNLERLAEQQGDQDLADLVAGLKAHPLVQDQVFGGQQQQRTQRPAPPSREQVELQSYRDRDARAVHEWRQRVTTEGNQTFISGVESEVDGLLEKVTGQIPQGMLSAEDIKTLSQVRANVIQRVIQGVRRQPTFDGQLRALLENPKTTPQQYAEFMTSRAKPLSISSLVGAETAAWTKKVQERNKARLAKADQISQKRDIGGGVPAGPKPRPLPDLRGMSTVDALKVIEDSMGIGN